MFLKNYESAVYKDKLKSSIFYREFYSVHIVDCEIDILYDIHLAIELVNGMPEDIWFGSNLIV
jgi:hypothetical protein